jgi:hypothetical protein
VDGAFEHFRAHTNTSNDTDTTLMAKSADEPRMNGEHTAFVTAAANLGPAAIYNTLVRKPRAPNLVCSLTDIHPCQHDRVVNPEQLGERGREHGL